MKAVKTDKLCKYFSKGRVKALDDFSLEVEPGKIFSLLGPNGAGKTTLIKTLLNILHPSSGNAFILDKPIADYHVHKQIGYLAENHRFPEFLSAGQVLYYYGKMSGIESSILKEKIPQLLKQVNLGEWINTKIRKYSKGMMQRMGLAHALINDPQLLFLDEPTDGIDPVGRREIRDMLKSLRDQGKTIFLNSHLLSEVERISDEVAILKDGRLLEKGSIEDFISIKEQYQLKVDGPGDKLHAIFNRAKISFEHSNDMYTISVKDETELNSLIDSFRNDQLNIQAIIPRKITLEDFFIDVIEDEKEKTE
jgi:ABC-2 type transport system ATP-binding protein